MQSVYEFVLLLAFMYALFSFHTTDTLLVCKYAYVTVTVRHTVCFSPV